MTAVRRAGQPISILLHTYLQKSGGKRGHIVEVGYPNISLEPFPSFQFDPFLSVTQNPSQERGLFPSRMNLPHVYVVILRTSPRGIYAYLSIHFGSWLGKEHMALSWDVGHRI